MQQLENIGPVEFCRKTGNTKAVEQNHATRAKKRTLSKVKDALSIIDKLGFKITIEPKE